MVSVAFLSGLITLRGGPSPDPGGRLTRTVLELRCIRCGTEFEKSFEQKRGDSDLAEGEMVKLEVSTCPNKCGGDWFAIAKQHPIRKFKRRY